MNIICIHIHMNIICILACIVCVNARTYLDCNVLQKQYFENERIAFGVDDRQTPFEIAYYMNSNMSYLPTTCVNSDNRIMTPNVTRFIHDNLNLDMIESPTNNLKYIPNYLINTITNNVWYVMGYSLIEYQNETFWYYANPNTDNVTILFHGINAMNGIENLYILHQLQSMSSVYMSIYHPSFIIESDYNNTYSQHVTNIIAFIENVLTNKNIMIFGNSYGSIRATTLCKRYDCSRFSNIILTDPINLNFPFSKIFTSMFHGMIARTDLTDFYRKITTVRVLRETKHFNHVLNNFDWHEWTIDTVFMQKYKKNLILVISTNDELITVNATSYAMTQICEVIYTNTMHGFVLFSSIFSKVGFFSRIF
jgi:hypothetical protein